MSAPPSPRPVDRWSRALVALLLLLGALGLALAAWAFWWEPSRFSVRAHALSLQSWPRECEGLRVAVLADLHVGSPWHGLAQLDAIVEATNTARPDLVLLAGDFVIHGVVGGRFVAPSQMVPALRRFRAPLGTWAVLGNHDWWYDARAVRRAMEAARIGVLDDRATPLVQGACRVWLAGISDYWEAPHDARAALRPVPDGASVLAFTHNPDLFPELPPGIDLLVAGHTHGGQVYLPFFGRPRVPSRYGERYAIGHRVEEGRDLFVSPGLGTSILPVRFRVPPEISLLTLSRTASGVRASDGSVASVSR